MIVSHKYKYLFVELPQTASSAIGLELMENYAGEKILKKHSNYRSFLKIATPEEKKYFVFSCVRNPLQTTISKYMKVASDHTSPEKVAERFRRDGYRKSLAFYWMQIQYNFIHKRDATFEQYFQKFYKHPYDDWSQLDHEEFDFIIRYENIQEDFAQALHKIGLEPLRPLPVRHKTAAKKSSDPNDYFKSEKIRTKAKRIFGIYMEKWNYTFPQEWGNHRISALNRLHHRLANYVRRFYWWIRR